MWRRRLAFTQRLPGPCHAASLLSGSEPHLRINATEADSIRRVMRKSGGPLPEALHPPPPAHTRARTRTRTHAHARAAHELLHKPVTSALSP